MSRFVMFNTSGGELCLNPEHVVAFGPRDTPDDRTTCWVLTVDSGGGDDHFIVNGTLTQVHGKLAGAWQGGQP